MASSSLYRLVVLCIIFLAISFSCFFLFNELPRRREFQQRTQILNYQGTFSDQGTLSKFNSPPIIRIDTPFHAGNNDLDSFIGKEVENSEENVLQNVLRKNVPSKEQFEPSSLFDSNNLEKSENFGNSENNLNNFGNRHTWEEKSEIIHREKNSENKDENGNENENGNLNNIRGMKILEWVSEEDAEKEIENKFVTETERELEKSVNSEVENEVEKSIENETEKKMIENGLENGIEKNIVEKNMIEKNVVEREAQKEVEKEEEELKEREKLVEEDPTWVSWQKMNQVRYLSLLTGNLYNKNDHYFC